MVEVASVPVVQPPPPMDRRRFLALGAASGLALSVPGVWGGTRPPLKQHALAHPSLLSLLGDADEIRALGRSYREKVPAENSWDALTTSLRRESPNPLPLVPESPMESQIQNDFEAGRTIQLNGWILAVTEARQCALYSLLS